MPLTVTLNDGGAFAALKGEFTIGVMEDIKPSLVDLLLHDHVVLDLSQVTEFDGSGLQLLKIVLTEAERKGQHMRIEQASPSMLECMQLLGFDKALSLPAEV